MTDRNRKPPSSSHSSPEDDIDTTWAAEIERRARRALSGESRGQDWRDACAEIERDRWGE